nr:Na+/H+ antiporter NhaA [Micromonospora sp. DSM 115978]
MSEPRVPARRIRRRVARRGVARRVDLVTEFLRQETNGGKLLIATTGVALLWANLAGGSYQRFWQAPLAVGPDWLHLDLTLARWVTEGLLAVFFFVAGLELKRELTVGELSSWRTATLPAAGALGGMVAPAVVALVVSGGAAAENHAWAIPIATDIAFALGVLALVGSTLPASVRALLLSMAVIDDLGAIALVAVLFANDLRPGWLLAAGVVGAGYTLAQRHRYHALWPVALVPATWLCVHAGGVHATVAGLFMGLLTPVRCGPGDEPPCERLERKLHPLSAGLVVPVFALAAAGIPLVALADMLASPVAHGVTAGLLVGKTAGILGAAWLAVRIGLARLPAGVGWPDLLPVAVLGGIGYTVSLLISRLAYPTGDTGARGIAAASVLTASATASVAAVLLLRRRGRRRAAAPAGGLR